MKFKWDGNSSGVCVYVCMYMPVCEKGNEMHSFRYFSLYVNTFDLISSLNLFLIESSSFIISLLTVPFLYPTLFFLLFACGLTFSFHVLCCFLFFMGKVICITCLWSACCLLPLKLLFPLSGLLFPVKILSFLW